MKNEFYISKSRKTIIKISEIIHCGLVHHSILKKDNVTKEDIVDGDNFYNPDCICFNMNNNHNVIMYFKTSREARIEFEEILKLIQENDI